MLEINTTDDLVTTISHEHALPQGREQWPAEALRAYRQLVNELNSWCRSHDSAAASNSWVAETAVREAWA